jgi:hypothetical protein
VCSKKDVPLLPLSSYLGANQGQKQGLQGGLDEHVPRPIGCIWFFTYQSTLTSFNINYIICRNVEIFKYNNNNKSKEQNFVKERREYFGIARNIFVLFDLESAKLIN